MKKKLVIGLSIMGIAICLCVYLAWYLVCVVKPKQEAITALKSGNYEEALNDAEKSLSADNNTETILLKDLATNCIDLVDKYDINDFPAVITEYEQIKDNASFYLVSTSIDEMYNVAKRKPVLSLKDINGSDFNKLTFTNSTDKFGDKLVLIPAGLANTIIFQVLNNGIDPAENLVVDFKLNDMYLGSEFTDQHWETVAFLRQHGATEVKYVLRNDELLYSKVPQCMSIDFNAAMIGPNATMTVSLMAKGCTPQKITIPIEVKG